MFQRIRRKLKLYTEKELEKARIQAAREELKRHQPLTDAERTRCLKLGFFPVTDDFWCGVGIQYAVGKGFNWAYYVPNGEKRKYMPFHEYILKNKSIEELAQMAETAKRTLS